MIGDARFVRLGLWQEDGFVGEHDRDTSTVLPLVRWRPTGDRNVQVLNDTADLYRFFDATPHAEFLFHCVEETVTRDLPQETGFLESYHRFAKRIQEIVDMPTGTVDLLFRFLRQNRGSLSARARRREFAALADNEVRRVEGIYAEEFEAEERKTGNAGAS